MRLNQDQQRRIARAAERIGGYFVKGIGRTLRLEVLGWDRVHRLLKNGTPVVLQVWHGEMFISWYVISPLRPAAIVSQAGDGDIASSVLKGLDYTTFRGSSTRGGKKAFIGMIKYLKLQERKVAAFASDGPQGPRRKLKAGTYVAAQHLNGYVVPVASNAKWKLKTNSWDKFSLPLPFSRAVLRFGDPIPADTSLRGDDLEKEISRVSELCKKNQDSLDNFYKI